MSKINFENDQQDVLEKTSNIDKLAHKIKEMQALQQQLELQEDAVKQKKKDIEYLSGEVIPTMLSEMGLSYLKLADGSSDLKAAAYAELAKGQGHQPTQKLKVEPMTLKALVRERIEGGKEMPTELFNVFIGNKTTIKRKQ